MTITERAAKVLHEIDADLAWMENEVPTGPWSVSDNNTTAPGDQPLFPGVRDANKELLLDIFGNSTDVKATATFAARSRTGWPTSLRMLKTAIEKCLDCESWDGLIHAMYIRQDADEILTTLCDQWETSRK